METILSGSIPIEEQFTHPLAEIDIKNDRVNDWCVAAMLVNMIMNPSQSKDNGQTAIASAIKFMKIANPSTETQAIIKNIQQRSLVSCLEAVNLIQEGINKTTNKS